MNETHLVDLTWIYPIPEVLLNVPVASCVLLVTKVTKFFFCGTGPPSSLPRNWSSGRHGRRHSAGRGLCGRRPGRPPSLRFFG